MREPENSDSFHSISDLYRTIHIARDSNGSPTQSLFKQHLTKNVDLVKTESSYTILVFQLPDSILRVSVTYKYTVYAVTAYHFTSQI